MYIFAPKKSNVYNTFFLLLLQFTVPVWTSTQEVVKNMLHQIDAQQDKSLTRKTNIFLEWWKCTCDENDIGIL